MLLATGRLHDFKACCARVRKAPRKGLCIDSQAAQAAGRQASATACSPCCADAAPRDQLRRHRRPQPQLCRAQPRQPRLDPQRTAAPPTRARRRCRASTRCAPTCALGLAQGIFLPHPRPNRAWLAALGTTIEDADDALAANAMSASAMWAANAATVSPAPDTRDGRCHLTVANLRTMPHRSHEWPATLAQLRLAFADRARSPSTRRCRRRSATKARPTTCGWRRRTTQPGVEMFVYGETGGPFPARQHVEACRAIARLHRLDPERTLFVEQSEEAIAAGAFHNDVVAVANEHGAVRARAGVRRPGERRRDSCERLLPGLEMVEVPAREVPLADAISSYLFNAQLVTLPDGEMTLIVPERSARDAQRLGLARAASGRQRPDPPGRSRRRPPVDGQWRRPRLPAPARRRRPGDGRSALPGRRGEARPNRRSDRAQLAGRNRQLASCRTRR